jgi:WD40 repeat protein
MSWDQNTASTTCSFGISTAVWSPCNGFIAIPLDDTAVGVLDSVTFQKLQTLKFPQDMSAGSMALIFSPDSHILTCSGIIYGDDLCKELCVISWDLQTGGIASIIRWQAPEQDLMGEPSMTYSANGRMIGVFYWYEDGTDAADIFICNIASGVYMHSHSLDVDVLLSNNIWTHGESLQFATADATTITIWEVEFVSGGTPTKVETFPTPDNFDPTMFPYVDNSDRTKQVQLLPTPCRLALAFMGKVLVWDVWNSRCLLDCADTDFCSIMSFSSNGCFFACSANSELYLWKESPTGYILHKILQLQTRWVLSPLLSPNGESIAVFYNYTIQLLHTNSLTTCQSSVFAQDSELVNNFVLDFSPDGTLAVVAMQYGNTITALNLKSGVPQLIIDAGTRVNGLRVIGNTIAVIGDQKVIAWNLPVGGCVPDAGVGLEDASCTTDLEDMAVILNGSRGEWNFVSGASISPDSCYIALTTVAYMEHKPGFRCLYIYNASTGESLGHKLIPRDYIPWFAPDGCNIWCATTDSDKVAVWRVGDGGDILEHLEHTADVKDPPEGYPWGSSCGYQVTDDWWILAPDGKRLLMLPPPWQSYPVRRVWKGQFLALLHEELSEPVILELEP